jgi:DNA-binding CsgD family transcriptional regulator
VENAAPASRMREILELVSHSHAAMMVIEVPSLVIAAASPGAREVLDPLGQPLIGHNLMDFLEGDPSGAMPLLAAGRLTGYETIRELKQTGQRRRVWMGAVPDTGPTQVALAVVLREDASNRVSVPWKDGEASSPVIGSTDAELKVDRVSSEVYESLGHFAEEVIGTSFLSLIVPQDVSDVLLALAKTSKHKEGVTLRVRVVGAGLLPVPCQLVLLPLTPAPRCAFALLRDDSHGPADGRSVADLITRLSRGIRGGMTSQAVPSAPIRSDVDLKQLSSREAEIVTRLMSGDRVPAIARQLFLSEGTVRNHLSSVFAKLGVGTQQELIELLRPRLRPL